MTSLATRAKVLPEVSRKYLKYVSKQIKMSLQSRHLLTTFFPPNGILGRLFYFCLSGLIFHLYPSVYNDHLYNSALSFKEDI